MKTDLIIISVVMVLLVFLPFYLLPLLQIEGDNKVAKIFKKEAAKLNLNLDIRQSWNLNMTGLDSATQKLLVVQRHEELRVYCFDLKEVKHTEMHVLFIPVVKSGKTENMLQKVEIEFSFYNREEKELLSLYDYELNTYQDFEVKNAEKLHGHLQKLVMAHPVIQRTA